jgi:hypothetical protein
VIDHMAGAERAHRFLANPGNTLFCVTKTDDGPCWSPPEWVVYLSCPEGCQGVAVFCGDDAVTAATVGVRCGKHREISFRVLAMYRIKVPT